MNSYKISKNLEELLISLIQDQINEKSSKIIKEMINLKNQDKIINKKSLVQKLSKNNDIIKEEKINSFENILERLNYLDYIEIKEENDEIIFKIDNILNILLYPRYCYYINSIYGPKYLKILEYLLEFGLYSLENNSNKDLNLNFARNDFDTLIRDGIILKHNQKKINNAINNTIFNTNTQEIFKLNYNLLNRIIFKEYIINFYRNYISMNYQFYDLLKKVVNSDNFCYELKNYEKTILDSQPSPDNFYYYKLLLNEDNKIEINKDIIKYDLFYNSIEKIIKLLYTSKHIRILKIIQRNENLNIFQISQKACLKYIEVEEIIDDLINKIKIINKIKKEQNDKDKDKDISNDNDFYCLKEINKIYINSLKETIYGIIKNIKFELKDKLKELQGRINKETEIQYINKYYSLISCFSEILNSYNFLFNNNIQ